MAKYCVSCGTANADNADFCSKCGKSIDGYSGRKVQGAPNINFDNYYNAMKKKGEKAGNQIKSMSKIEVLLILILIAQILQILIQTGFSAKFY